MRLAIVLIAVLVVAVAVALLWPRGRVVGGLSFEFGVSPGEYRVVGNVSIAGCRLRLVRVEFRSCSWGGSTWTHRLLLLIPRPTRSHLVFLTAGGFGPNPNATFRYIAGASVSTGVVVAIVTEMPNTPPGVDESVLMAKSNLEALRTGDPHRSLLYPMAQAYIKAATVVEEILPKKPGGFVLSGGSKRGWATWVAARHDPRVVAFVPRSFNAANVSEVSVAQLDAYGRYTGVMGRLREALGRGNLRSLPGYERFVAEYNPVEWIGEVADKPVLVLMGTNDQLFPPGLEATYMHLHPNLHVVYMPNATHTGLHGLRETWMTALSFVRYVEEGRKWPSLSVEVSGSDSGVTVGMGFTGSPDEVYLLYAPPTRVGERYSSYVNSGWRAVRLRGVPGEYTLGVEEPVGIYVMAVYREDGLEVVATSPIRTLG